MDKTLYAVWLGAACGYWFAGTSPAGRRMTSLNEPWTTTIKGDAEEVARANYGEVKTFELVTK